MSPVPLQAVSGPQRLSQVPPNLHAGAPSSGVAQTRPFPPDGPRAHGVMSIIQRPDVSFPYTGMWS